EKYEKLGYDVIKDGLPDLLILKDGKLEFIEVKFKFDDLNPNQIRAFRLLKKHKIPVRKERVAQIHNSPLLKRWKKEVKNSEM
ncbi:unnamed protein product, partial [marine sediment metagenome]